MDDIGWICSACTHHNHGSQFECAMCNTLFSGYPSQLSLLQPPHSTTFSRRNLPLQSLLCSFSVCSVPRLLAGAFSGALTGMFAIVGAFTGAVTGALAGRATDSGLLRGAGLGAVAGAVLSVEVLEASRAYWYREQSGSRSSSSVTDFIEDLLNGRFVQEQMAPSMLTAHRWQVDIAEMSYGQLYEIFGPGEGWAKGASEARVGSLPWYSVTEENRRDCTGETICCTICLQELLQGETARSLPPCHHVFHMTCVDKWLMRHGSCPVCRRGI